MAFELPEEFAEAQKLAGNFAAKEKDDFGCRKAD
jgi:hypothetical protein